MRAIVQRVSKASVTASYHATSNSLKPGAARSRGEQKSIGRGLVVLVGIEVGDTDDDAIYIADKVTNLRVFEDTEQKFHYSAKQLALDILIVSNFTLMAETRKGRRPSFSRAATSTLADPIFTNIVEKFAETKLNIVTGYFGQNMSLEIHNDGPVTILIDSRKRGL
ncbi:MAG: D-tyrosyl-tRNA(Tyr) deacylase [SAR202 cluster bacterium]|nr:D-tyrosyl-tRNA(Tyr) deacylase [SAR202 cluster bacterium]